MAQNGQDLGLEDWEYEYDICTKEDILAVRSCPGRRSFSRPEKYAFIVNPQAVVISQKELSSKKVVLIRNGAAQKPWSP